MVIAIVVGAAVVIGIAVYGVNKNKAGELYLFESVADECVAMVPFGAVVTTYILASLGHTTMTVVLWIAGIGLVVAGVHSAVVTRKYNRSAGITVAAFAARLALVYVLPVILLVAFIYGMGSKSKRDDAGEVVERSVWMLALVGLARMFSGLQYPMEER